MEEKKTVVLIILDGFGLNADPKANAILHAKTPILDALYQQAPNTALLASGTAVGLPPGQMGNSEVGHLTLGAGRILEQDLSRIGNAIQSGIFFENPVLKENFEALARKNGTLHLMGLLSPGGVHSHEDHFFATIKMAKKCGVKKLSVHAFLDGRDTPPKSAETSIEKLEMVLKDVFPYSYKIASLCGRYYAMDRDKRYERTKICYDLLTDAKADYQAHTALEGLKKAYERGESDEFVKPTWINEATPIQDGDALVFMNFRADRARQLTAAFLDSDFKGFERKSRPRLLSFISLNEYSKNLPTLIAFPSPDLKNTLGEILEKQNMTQLRIAETEKYAHVTFFFNGGRETPFKGEDRILIPSPKVATYDQKPEMSANEITENLVKRILEKRYDLIVCNFANADMLGHTGNFDATVQSIETLDQDLGKIIEALNSVGGEAIITADHGNAECMFDENTGQAHTAHTTSEVPFIYVGASGTASLSPKANAGLMDIAPTLLYLLGLPACPEMKGETLIKK